MPDFDIARWVQKMAILLPGFLLAITVHEAAHGLIAWKLGDPTAKQAGRLTLNPLKHLDPVGTLVLVVTQLIGWAKPVPVDSRYFKDPLRGMMLVGLAGPAANFICAVLLSRAYVACMGFLAAPDAAWQIRLFVPLAGICQAGMVINLVLGYFNLLPIPPLDGSNIVAGLLPVRTALRYMAFGRYGFIVIILLAMTGILGDILLPVVQFMADLLL